MLRLQILPDVPPRLNPIRRASGVLELYQLAKMSLFRFRAPQPGSDGQSRLGGKSLLAAENLVQTIRAQPEITRKGPLRVTRVAGPASRPLLGENRAVIHAQL